ncbi:MAG: hypothetical protein KatS3mg127_0242 [Silanimonas sp.]|nr:MAG: hypothetical protein KatS3mg127_0242 [Silanimonas sp.]
MDLFELSGGTAALAFGGEYRKEFYKDLYDSLSEAGVVSGSAGNSSDGSRQVRAVYVEALFPILNNFEINVAARHDRYSDYGNDTSPKISFRYSPLDTLTLRASYGEGFRAPTLDILNAKAAFSADSVTHAPTCVAFGLPSTCSTQINAYVIANPNLESENSKQWSVGGAWDATSWLNLSLDYYNIKVENRIAGITSNQILSCLAGTTANCPPGLSTLPANAVPPNPSLGLGAAFGSAGEVLYIQRGFTNLGTVETSGADLNVRTNFDFADFGTLQQQFQLSYVRDYSVDGGANIVNEPSTPRYRAVLQNQWSISDFSVAWNINYIHKTDSTAKLAGDTSYPDYLPAWVTHDLQVNWNAPWNGRFTLGVNNIADKDPVLDPYDPTGRGFDFALYDGYGRVPYFRYTQNF